MVVKQLANQRGSTAGKVISDLVRQALEPRRKAAVRNGVRIVEKRKCSGSTEYRCGATRWMKVR
jgi:hypothetical protein